MKKELEEMVKKERKNRRELAELRAMRSKVSSQVQPDQKVLKMIDEEIAKLLS